MTDRADRVRALIDAPLLVTKPVNVWYLTGLESSNAAALVEPDRLRVFTDFRYAEKAHGTGLEVSIIARRMFSELPGLLPQRVAFEAEHLIYSSWAAIDQAGIETVPTHSLLESVRAVKEDAELEAISRAAAITNECFERLAEQPFVGRTERELAWFLESLMHEVGADGPSFPIIVGSGANGSTPHASTGDRVIEEGQTVVVDAAARLNGYYSDCTRTFATGALPGELARSYEVCKRAQAAALEAVRPGMTGREADAVARDVISAEGLGQLFGHGLGHGVGAELQEMPWLQTWAEDRLAAGMVATIEPGIYHPGLGGIRIEDLVIIEDDGPQILTTFTKELVTVS
jgi:Xaa-Pro aminopeptidase